LSTSFDRLPPKNAYALPPGGGKGRPLRRKKAVGPELDLYKGGKLSRRQGKKTPYEKLEMKGGLSAGLLGCFVLAMGGKKTF